MKGTVIFFFLGKMYACFGAKNLKFIIWWAYKKAMIMLFSKYEAIQCETFSHFQSSVFFKAESCHQ